MQLSKTNFSYNNNYNTSFKALKHIKVSKNFNPRKNVGDMHILNSVLTSDAFRFLMENADVSLKFNRLVSTKDAKIYTIFNYEFSPLANRPSKFIDKIKKYLKSKILKQTTQKRSIVGWVDTKTNARSSLIDKINNISKDDMEKILNK